MTFTAQFNTLCGACGEWIRPGDQIKVTGEGSLHEDCDQGFRFFERTKPACGRCWQIPAASGVCGCDA